ncbi:unnamed protein product [Camellia sinensis]|uniref:probable root meristem growth factor 8 n=1 Tax=Camellia sinensis TaxID=4442 RepID=UPI0010363202|nr:probable root meristem growth factor 8 [Camellia sinensis]
MELIIVITTLCICLSVLLTPCASQQIQVQSSHDQAKDVKFSLLTLPRKLRVIEEAATVHATVNEDKELLSYSKQRASLSGKQHNKEADMKFGRRGTWQEWVEEGTDRTQFFTMDYSHVRRRRPIHNKSSVPVGP